MIAAAMALLAIVDAAFAGFRAAAGRDARIRKGAYFRRAVWLGGVAGLGLVVLLAAATLATLVASPDPWGLYGELLSIGARMLRVLVAYAVLVVAALTLYGTSDLELRTLASVTILGPFTLLRPWVVVVATAWGLVGCRSGPAAALTVVSSSAVLLLGKLLDLHYGRASDPRVEWPS